MHGKRAETGFMRRAVEMAREGIARGQSPFGAVIARDGTILSAAHNTVLRDADPTAHAEVNAIREAARSLGTHDLAGCTIYSTCEPCPMCLAAIHWAKIAVVRYGARIADAEAAGFSEMRIPAEDLARLGASPLTIEGGLLEKECRALFTAWKNGPRNEAY